MQKSTKSIVKTLSVFIIAAMLFSLSACNNDDSSGGTTTPATTTTAADAAADTPDTPAEEAADTPVVDMPTASPITVSISDYYNGEGTLVYDGKDDLNKLPDNPGCDFPAYQDEIDGDGAGRFAYAGEPDIFLGIDGRGIGVSGRNNEWDSIDVTVGGLEPGKYILAVVFNASYDVTFNIKEADSPWDSLASEEGQDDTLVTAEIEIVEEGKGANNQNRYRVNLTDDPDLATYYVKAVGIYQLD